MPAIPPHTTPTNTEASWDGPAAMAAAPNDGDVLRYMSTWFAGDDANPDVKVNYKLPHHEPGIDTAAIIAGVNNALARLAVTDVPMSDKPEIEAHLRKHRYDAGLEESMGREEIEAACANNPRWVESVLLQENRSEALSGAIVGEISPLAEKSVRRDGTIEVKVIQPGWGSSGYYPKDVLERDMPMTFKPGTHMYWNHATVTEQMERPERDLSDLAGVLVSAPRWRESGKQGPGMYADAKIFSGYSQIIDEIGEHIGVSIFGSGITEQGEAEGRKGNIVKSITNGQSVDFVTKPGAGGAIVSLFESATRGDDNENEPLEEVVFMDEKLQEAERLLAEKEATIAQLQEKILLQEAADFVGSVLAKSDLPGITRQRLQKELSYNPPVTDGKLDTAAYGEMVEVAINEAKIEVASILKQDGRVIGMGGTEKLSNGVPTLQESRKSIDDSLRELGYGN